MLTMINNAIMAKKKSLKVPYSKINLAIAESLVKFGYLKSAQKKGRTVKKIISIDLNYDESGESAIKNIKFLSKSSRRVYKGYNEIRFSKQGYGNYFLSTPKGILADVEAKKMKVGGEMLFEIW